MYRRHAGVLVLLAVATSCGGMGGPDAGTGGGAAGGSTAGGTAGGSTAGGTAGGSTAGGTAGGSTAGGTAGGSTAGGTAGGSTAGGAAGGSTAGGTADAGVPDAGVPDAGVPDAGCGCGSRQCLSDGGCADCLLDLHCPTTTPVCDTTRSLCVRCRTTNDTCDAGTYCTTQGACVRGCRTGADCRTGLCLPSHDCVTCQGDTECESTRVCGSGICGAPCATAATCTLGYECCGTRCVDTTRDPAHCGACTQPCVGETFCGASSCRPTLLSNVCNISQATALLDGLREDDDAGITMAQGLASLCVPSVVTASAVRQLDSGVLDAITGEPLLFGPMLCVGGGSFFQRSIGWLESVNLAPVTDTSTSTQYRLSLRDGGVVATGPVSALGPTRDLFVVQLVRAPTGAVVLNTGGFYGEGTTAGAWYFRNVLLPMRASLTSGWYVIDWTDVNANGPDMMDTFVQVAP